MNNNTKVILFASLIAAIAIPLSGINDIFAEIDEQTYKPIEQGNTDAYTIEEIEHSFAVMEQYVIYDENKNITFDTFNARNDHDVTQQDIDIALDFAVHNNEIMDAVIGHVGQVNEFERDDTALRIALDELEQGKFRALFDNEDSGSVGKVNEITFTIYERVFTPTISAFGVEEYNIHEVRHDRSSNLACGGNYQNPHPLVRSDDSVSGFNSLYGAQQALYLAGYHMVPAYASWGGGINTDIDFAKVVTSGAPGGCNNGPFRDQAIINRHTYEYSVTEDEPNPEVLSYLWPRFWWGPYVEWWHDNF